MKRIGINSLAPRTFYSDPVFLDKGYILTSPDIPISASLRNRLAKWGFTSVYTAGEGVAEAPAENPSEAHSPTTEITRSYEDEQGKKQAVEFFSKSVQFLEDAFSRFKEKQELRIVSFTDMVKEIIVELKHNRRFMLSLDDAESPGTTYLTTHSVKTTILALAIADYMKMASFKQIDLGLAGILHEVGLMKFPEDLYLSDRSLSPQEKQKLMAHPVLGYRILKEIGFPQNTCLAVLEQNERLDGSGFPRKVTGDKLSEYGRILAVSTSYNAATSIRPYKAEIDGHAGLMDLLKDAGKRYDEKILAALVYTLSLYPIGTHVRMSNGAIGLVVKANEADPRFPLVKLVIDENGNRYQEQPTVQTREGDDIKIVDSLSKEELVEITSRK